MEIFSRVIEFILILFAIIAITIVFKYPKQILIVMPKAILRAIIDHITLDLFDFFLPERVKKKRKNKH